MCRLPQEPRGLAVLLPLVQRAGVRLKVAGDPLVRRGGRRDPVQQSVAAGDAGKVARDRIDREMRQLSALQRDGTKIKFEILQGQADKLSADAAGGRVSVDHKEEPIIVDDEHFQWRFDGEYWKDELGYYRFKIRSRCPKQ